MNRTTRFSLGQRFYSALIILCVLGLLAWGLFVARRAGDDFERHARELVDRGVRQVEDLLVREAATRSDLMERAVGHLSDNLSRELEDIPFEVFERRQDLLVSFLRDRLEEGRRRNHANSVVIAGLIREASSARLRREIAQLEAQARADRDRQSRRVLRDMLAWGGSFLLGIGILVGLAFHHLVARPLRRASEVVDRMGQGELGERMSEQGADEIVSLARSFNAMATSIADHQEGLEQRVALKTSKLRAALDDQQSTNDRLRQALAELENTQTKLIESAKMAALGRLSRGMAHEFNNILGGIGGCAEDLLVDAHDDDTREVLEVILRASRRARIITENLLSFSRGRSESSVPTSVREVLASAAILVEPEAGRREIEITVEGDAGPHLMTDARGLQQVFLNLLINAVQASDRGDRVRARFQVAESGQEVVVEDEGRGIAAEHLERVFEPFFTTKDLSGGGGTGLGLAVSRDIVRGLGGELSVRSEGLGRGSRFTVRLPAERNEDCR